MNYALFIKHSDPNYLTSYKDPGDPDILLYKTPYFALANEIRIRTMDLINQGLTDGEFVLHSKEDCCIIERHWLTEDAARSYADYAIKTHPLFGAPEPIEVILKNLITLEEKIIHPVVT